MKLWLPFCINSKLQITNNKQISNFNVQNFKISEIGILVIEIYLLFGACNLGFQK